MHQSIFFLTLLHLMLTQKHLIHVYMKQNQDFFVMMDLLLVVLLGIRVNVKEK